MMNYYKLVKTLRNPTKAKNKALDSPWRERFSSLSVDENEILYIADRLKFPKILQTSIKSSLHWGHPGRDQMLRQTSAYDGPKITEMLPYLRRPVKNIKKQKSIKPILKEK